MVQWENSGKLSHLTAVTALRQETYEVAKVIQKKKRCQFTLPLGQNRLTFFFNKTIYESICKGEE